MQGIYEKIKNKKYKDNGGLRAKNVNTVWKDKSGALYTYEADRGHTGQSIQRHRQKD